MENKNAVKNAPATVAKIRSIYGKRLRSDDFSEMLECRTVQEAAEFLKNTAAYGETLASVDTNTVHRGLLEDLLHKHEFMTYIRVAGFEQLNKQEFFNFRILREEIEQILECIRYINAGETDKHIQTMPVYMNDYLSFDMIGLAQVKSFSDLLDFTSKTEYHNLLKFFAPEEGEKIDYTGCEVRLRRYYYNRLMESAKLFGKKTADELSEFIGVQTDLINIINSYRMTAYFHEDAEKIRRLMLPFGHMSQEKMEELYASADGEDFTRRLEKTYYGRLMKRSGIESDDLETAALRLQYDHFRRELASVQEAPAAVYAFNYLMENEVRNIIRVIEGIRYSVPRKNIEPLLIL